MATGIGGEAGEDGLEEVADALSTTFEQAEALMEESGVYAAAIKPLQATRRAEAGKQPPGGGVGVAELERRLKAVKGEIERLARRRGGAGGGTGEGASAGGDRQNERLVEVRSIRAYDGRTVRRNMERTRARRRDDECGFGLRSLFRACRKWQGSRTTMT